MKPYGQIGIIRNIRDFVSWAQHVTNLRNMEDIPAYNRMDARLTAVEGAGYVARDGLIAGTNVTLTYDAPSDTLTIAASGGGGNSYFPSGW